MRFGVGYFPTDESVPPDEMARMVADRGLESLFFTDHTHIPVSRETPYPAGTELPREYSRIVDPLIAIAAAASVTDTLRLGTGVLLVTQRDPIVTAKQVASADLISGGRVIFGVGAGWNLEEMRNHGTDPDRRFGLMRERVEAMKAIWTADEASYRGKHVDFDPIWSWPKPVQSPHPPVIIGGNASGAPKRVLRYGDGWMPNRLGDDDRIMARISRLRDAGIEAGRGPLPTTLANAPKDPALIERYEEAGADRMLYWLPPGDHADTERRLDRYAGIASAYG